MINVLCVYMIKRNTCSDSYKKQYVKSAYKKHILFEIFTKHTTLVEDKELVDRDWNKLVYQNNIVAKRSKTERTFWTLHSGLKERIIWLELLENASKRASYITLLFLLLR